MLKLSSYKIQDIQKFLWECHNKLRIHFKEPEKKLYDNYIFTRQDEKLLAISNWYRNYLSLRKFELMIYRLGELLICIDFFNDNIKLMKKTQDFSNDYKRKFMLSIGIDSVRSSLDIFAKSIGWFFDLKSKENFGFGWDGLIKPLKSINLNLFKKLNELYSIEEYQIIKNFRDNEKHSGHDRLEYSYKSTGKSFEINFKRNEIIPLINIEDALCKTINEFFNTIEVTIVEMLKYDFYYKAEKDVLGQITDNGFITFYDKTA